MGLNKPSAAHITKLWVATLMATAAVAVAAASLELLPKLNLKWLFQSAIGNGYAVFFLFHLVSVKISEKTCCERSV